jgi:hypothetical protein
MFLRQRGLIQLLGLLVVWTVVLVAGTTPVWVLIVLGVGTAFSVWNFASLSWRVRRLS